jgi:Secretion system C-terminal sorting domain
MQFKKYVFSIGLICLATLGWSQTKVGLMNNGANLVIMPKTYMRVAGDVTTQKSGQLINNGIIALSGNFAQLTKGLYKDTTNSLIAFVDNAEQMVQSDALTPIQITNLSVNNQNGLVLKSHLAIKEGLELMPNSKLKLGNYNVNLAKNVKFYQIGANNYIVTNGTGSVQQLIMNGFGIFPIGNSSYNPLQLINNGQADTFKVRVEDRAPAQFQTFGGFESGCVKRVWEISKQINSVALIALDLYWSEKEELPYFHRNNSMIDFYTTFGTPIPRLSPAIRSNNLWKNSNDNIQMIGLKNFFWVAEASSTIKQKVLNIKPNPARSYIIVTTTAEDVGQPYEIVNLLSTVVQKGIITSSSQEVNIESLQAGNYFLVVNNQRTRFVKL